MLPCLLFLHRPTTVTMRAISWPQLSKFEALKSLLSTLFSILSRDVISTLYKLSYVTSSHRGREGGKDSVSWQSLEELKILQISGADDLTPPS